MSAAQRLENNETSGMFLRACLAPFETILSQPEVTDVYVNRPGEVWVESLGGKTERHVDDRLTAPVLQRLAQQLAALTHQGINREHPLLSSTLLDGARIQIVAPPATRGPMAIAIRKHGAVRIRLADYEAGGAFAGLDLNRQRTPPGLDEVQTLLRAGQVAAALQAAVRGRLNILVSGGTSSGKTTFVNALLAEVPETERLILIEDTPELAPPHENLVGLIAVRGQLGEARVSADDLLSASLRMRPDRIILGELRGSEAFAFLRAVNSGHPGSMTTIHADSPARAVEQLVLLALSAGVGLTRDDVRHYVKSTIDLFVQIERKDGQRRVTQVTARDLSAQ